MELVSYHPCTIPQKIKFYLQLYAGARTLKFSSIKILNFEHYLGVQAENFALCT